jgi:N-acetylglucosamine-6-phosphate deacetylase
MEFLARRYDDGQAVRVVVHQGRIAELPRVAQAPPHLPYVAPGFVDIQVNGYGGQEFSSLELTADKVADIVRRHDAFGVARLCPTLTTQSEAVLAHGLECIAAACQRWPDVARRVAGIHLEGPFIAAEDGPRGAHPAEHCRPPDWPLFERLQRAAAGRIVLLTLSPEYDEAPQFIRRATAAGLVVAIGHTGATGEQIRAAVDAGAQLSTHLGNGAHRMLRRHPNYLWDQLAEDRLMASLIVDGQHLPPEVVRVFIRAKTPQRCILVSDVSGLAGLPPGRYTGSGCQLEILPDGRLVIAGQDQLLAGASFPIGTGVANAVGFAGIDLATAVDMATLHPARLLGLRPVRLRPGDDADLVVFHWHAAADAPQRPHLQVVATLQQGQVVYGQLAAD